MAKTSGLARASNALRRLDFAALGTHCQVQYETKLASQAKAFEQSVLKWMRDYEARYSRFRPDSLVSRINDAAGKHWLEVDAEMEQMLSLCDTVHTLSEGVLDVTALPLLRLWNYKAQPLTIPRDEEIEKARQLVGWRKVQRSPGKVFLPERGMALDFGGFGKEWAVDVVGRVAQEHGIANALVDFGHDIRVLGTPPGRPAWHIGLENPARPGTCEESIAVPSGRGIASSGDYIRQASVNGRRYGHILDPRTGRPVANGCRQVTVVAGSCLQAGILSTTCFILGLRLGLERIQATPGAEGIITTDDARGQTRGFWQYLVR